MNQDLPNMQIVPLTVVMWCQLRLWLCSATNSWLRWIPSQVNTTPAFSACWRHLTMFTFFASLPRISGLSSCWAVFISLQEKLRNYNNYTSKLFVMTPHNDMALFMLFKVALSLAIYICTYTNYDREKFQVQKLNILPLACSLMAHSHCSCITFPVAVGDLSHAHNQTL